MLAAKAVLPSLIEVVRPNAAGLVVDGFAVPLRANATKDDLAKPMERGVYAVSTSDRKTVLKLRVFSKEEANFDPVQVLSSSLAQTLDAESQDRIRSTWTLMQLTFEAYDPKLYPALDFVLQVASRLGSLTDGLIADPLAGQYRMPESLPSPRGDGENFSVQDFVTVQSAPSDSTVRLTTAGMVKFGHPEITISVVPLAQIRSASSALLSTAAGVMKGKTLSPGDVLVVRKKWIVGEVAATGPGWIGTTTLELLPAAGTLEETLAEEEGV